MAFFGLLGFSSVSCVLGEGRGGVGGGASFAGLLFAHKTWVTLVCLLLGTSFWRRSVGITFVTTGGNVRQLIQ